MFIRVNRTPNSPRKSIQICENYRKDGKVKQRIVHYVGVALDDTEEEKLKSYAQELIAKITLSRQQESRQLSLLPLPTEEEVLEDQKRKLGRPTAKKLEDILPPSQVSLDDIVEESRIIEGVHDIAGKMFDDIYGDLLSSKRQFKVLKDIVLARLVYPSSKHRAQARLSQQFGKAHSLDAIYRMMDFLFENIDLMKQLTFRKTQALFPEKIDLLLFDVTTLYFESTNVDELRKFGYSKDHRFNTTQVVLALATNQDGLPIGYELFEGNKAEVKTLIVAIEKWKALFCIDSVCFVGDRAMFCEENLQLLESKQYHYIIAAKLKTLPDSLKSDILEEKNYQPQALGDELGWIGEFPYNLFSCALLCLPEVPKDTELDRIMDKNIYAYAFIDNAFYAINRENRTCRLLGLTQESTQQLQKYLPQKQKNRKHYWLCSTLAPTDAQVQSLPNKNAAAYIQIENDSTQLFYIESASNKLLRLPISHEKKSDFEKMSANLKSGNLLLAKELSQISALTEYTPEKSPILKKVLSEKELENIQSIAGHSFCRDKRLIVSYKSKRAFKDQTDREHLINKIKKIIGKKGNPNKLISNTGVKQFITQDEKAYVQLDQTKIERATQWDGLHGIITNIPEESPGTLILRYSKLWTIEESFRINKHTLQMRPIFHWKPERIHAHIGICYMTFSVLRHLQYQVNLTKKVSINEILDELLNVQASIYVHKKTKDRYRIPGYFTHNARKIYKAFSLERSLDATIYLP